MASSAKKPTGRPAFTPTPALRRKVAAAAGGGMSHESIAIAIGVSRPTLEKHFSGELSTGAYQRRLEVLEAMQRAAKKGSVSAAKAYLANTPEFSPLPSESDKPAAPAPVAKLGKKEAADAAAVTAQAGTGWEGLLPGASLQ